MKENNLLEAALYYAEKLYWPVIALHSPAGKGCSCQDGAECKNIGKHPRWDKSLQPEGAKSATLDPALIRKRWRKWPKANIGIATGAGSFDVLDVDLKGDGPDTLYELERLHGRIPDTVEQITGSGGRQIMFAYAGGTVKNKVRFASGLDTRSDGGLVVVPPSLHASGRTYEWEVSSRPGEVPLAPMPAWLLGLVNRGANGTGTGEGVNIESMFAGVPEGERDQNLFRYACRLRTKGLDRREAEALVLHAAGCCTPPFPREEAMKKVEQAWKYPEGGTVDSPRNGSSTHVLNRAENQPVESIPKSQITETMEYSDVGKCWQRVGGMLARRKYQ